MSIITVLLVSVTCFGLGFNFCEYLSLKQIRALEQHYDKIILDLLNDFKRINGGDR